MTTKYSRNKYLPDGSLNPHARVRDRTVIDSGRKRSGKRLSMFNRGEFIAIDGEGGDYEGKHVYQFLSSSTNEIIYNVKGLTTEQCLDYIIRMGDKHPRGIFVIFAGSYDGNFWLRDLPRETLEEIKKADGKYPIYWRGYGISFIQRKFFSVTTTGRKKAIRIWDVWGFFQGSFVDACKKWIPDFPDLQLIIEGKSRRVDFHESDYDFMVRYNRAENQALVQLMVVLRDTCKAMDLQLVGWHGAGALASAIYKSVNIKQFLPDQKYDDAIHIASKCAYFGGRIEIGKFGNYENTVHHYDINSAYPAAMPELPNMNDGHWIKHGSGYDPRSSTNVLIMCKVKWSHIVNTEFCPFPYRSKAQRKVLFPTDGMCWIWKPEIVEALNWRDKKYHYWEIEILEAYEFIPADNQKPFAFVPDYYDTRQKLVAEAKRTGKPNGQEKGIKLGLNSLYGKLAQRIGYDEKTGKLPPYHNLYWAGYITSKTRATLWTAAMQKPDKVICMATDGLYMTESLDLDCPQEKILGAWEYQTHDGMTLIQSGVYFLIDKGKFTFYSRGFDKLKTQAEMQSVREMILCAWKKREYEVCLPCTRLITMKSALISDIWFTRWLSWYEFKQDDGRIGRLLKIHPEGTKRGVSGSKHLLAHNKLIQTEPTANFTPDDLSDLHDIPWDDDDLTVEQILENEVDGDI